MPLITYERKTFNAEHEDILGKANQIIRNYQRQGYDLTLRQLYYQFVSRDWFPEGWADRQTGSTNNERSYKKLGDIISAGRRAGRIDWAAIVDRGRTLERQASWDSPEDIVRTCASQFTTDLWATQPYRPEVWVEKDALSGVLEVACTPLQVSYFACRGYVSDSAAWAAAQRLAGYAENDQTPLVIHLGDHDPSGIDMTRDIFDRVNLFTRNRNLLHRIEVRRIALNMDQVRQYNPPPNPAKVTDSRYAGYRDEHGEESWELDAIEPVALGRLITDTVLAVRDEDAWAAAVAERDEGRRKLRETADRWEELTDDL